MAIQLYARIRRKCDYREWKVFPRWMEKDVHNRAHCDALGPMLIAHPEWVVELKAWVGSKAKYKRLVAPLKGIRKGLFRAEAEELLGLLARDPADIVKKGLVWLRRELKLRPGIGDKREQRVEPRIPQV